MKKQMIPNMTPIVIVPIIIGMILIFGMLAAGCEQVQQEQPKPKPSIAVGTWINSEKIAEKDNQSHPMKYKIVSIIRDQKLVTAAIEDYNLSGSGNIIAKLESKELEFCIVKYSATYPKDFPQSVFGITDVTVPFEIVSLTGGNIQVRDTIYENLTTTWEIGEVPQGYDFYAGDTYHGQVVFVMVKGYDEYLIHEIKGERNETNPTYIKGE